VWWCILEIAYTIDRTHAMDALEIQINILGEASEDVKCCVTQGILGRHVERCIIKGGNGSACATGNDNGEDCQAAVGSDQHIQTYACVCVSLH